MEDFKILVCEDDELAREFLVRRLKREFESVFEAEDGEEGLAKYNSSTPDLIVTDINMPKMDGIEMIKEIRSKDKEVPIIVISAFSDNENLLDCIENGVNGYIVKPVDSKKILDVIKNFRDVKELKTLHKRNERKLQGYKTAFDQGSLVLITDKDGFITHVNEGICEVTGYSKAELIGQNSNIFRHPNMPSSEFEKMWKLILNGESYKGIIESKNKDGSSFVSDTTIVPIKNEKDEIEEFISIKHNLTEVTDSYEKYLESIIEDSDVLNVVLNEHYLPIILNESFKDFFGDVVNEKIDFLSKIIFEDQEICNILEPFTCGKLVEKYKMMNKQHQKVKVFLGTGDSYKIFMFNINTVRNSLLQRRKYHILTFTDITEFEKMKDEQLSSSKLAYIGQLSASITHEINTPLTYIKGNLELMKMDLEDYVTDEKHRQEIFSTMKTIDSGIKRIASIIDTMRETTGVSDNSIVNFNLYTTLIYSLRIIYARSKHISPIYINGKLFTLSLDKEEEEYKALIAPQRVEQVWIILLNNALDELEKSDLEFNARYIKVEVFQENGRVKIHFKDNGGGVDSTIIDKIFSSFVTTKKGSHNSGSGMGLGLNIAKTIIDNNNGTISAENDPYGAVFKIEFDCVKE